MMIARNLTLLFSFITFYGCSYIPGVDQALPDKRNIYKKSKDLPALEVPPDLTITEGEYTADIPGEESTSLSEFERQRAQNKRRGAVLGSGEEEGEQWLALRGASIDIWPELREFWDEKEYTVELDDVELGVFETDWKEVDGSRHKFRIFTEPNESGGTILFLSSERQTLSAGEWLNTLADTSLEKDIMRKINLHFYGTEARNVVRNVSPGLAQSVAAAPVKNMAEIFDIGDGKRYLAIPQDFTRAWFETKMVIEEAGYSIAVSNQEKGIYEILYFKPESEKGFLSKLKFWGEDEGRLYQLTLTGVGDKTEVIIMNKAGEWSTDEDANAILTTLKDLYNQR